MSYLIRNNAIHIKLPLTEPTSMARIKQRSSLGEIGQPVAPKQRDFTTDFYLEWQIAYDTLDENKSINGVSFTRVKIADPIPQTKYIYELSDYLYSSIVIGLLPLSVITELVSFGKSVQAYDYVETAFYPTRKKNPVEFRGSMDFSIYNEELPVLIHDCSATYIEMMVKPKQRAVGNQAMLFYDIPITEVVEWQTLKGRPAKTKEQVTFVIDKNNSSVLVQLTKCFMLASQQHNCDLLAILKAIKADLEKR